MHVLVVKCGAQYSCLGSEINKRRATKPPSVRHSRKCSKVSTSVASHEGEGGPPFQLSKISDPRLVRRVIMILMRLLQPGQYPGADVPIASSIHPIRSAEMPRGA